MHPLTIDEHVAWRSDEKTTIVTVERLLCGHSKMMRETIDEEIELVHPGRTYVVKGDGVVADARHALQTDEQASATI